MKFDGRIYKIEGASDLEDSSMFCGLISLFEYKKVDLLYFIVFGTGWSNYVRHPYGPKYSFSRDQYLCLSAGLCKQHLYSYVNEEWISGKDLLSPANHGHTKRCQGLKANWFQNLWLKAEILFHAYVKPIDEPNQLIAMMIVAGDDYLKLWTKHNKQWERSLRKYWYQEDGAWRNEPEFCEHMISEITKRIK